MDKLELIGELVIAAMALGASIFLASIVFADGVDRIKKDPSMGGFAVDVRWPLFFIVLTSMYAGHVVGKLL